MRRSLGGNAAVFLYRSEYSYTLRITCEKMEKHIAFFVKIFYDIKEYICV